MSNLVKERGEKILGKEVKIERVENPRVEMDQHYYNPENKKLKTMGYSPVGNLRKDIDTILSDVDKFRDRAEALKGVIQPKTYWRNSRGMR